MKNVLWISLLALFMASCAEKPQTISGHLDNLEDGEVVLEKFDLKGRVPVDTATLTAGNFTFTYSPESTELYFVKTEKTSFPVFLDNNSVKISGDVDSVETIVVKGSLAHDLFDSYNTQMKSYDEKEGELVKEYRTAAASQNKEVMDATIEKYNAMQEEKTNAVLDFIKGNSTSEVSAFLAYITFRGSEAEEMGKVLEVMDTTLSSNTYYAMLSERKEKLDNVAIGKIAPDFTMDDTEGNPVTLSSLRGKYILMDFWASWCGPCRRENPNVVKMYAEYKDKNFDIIGISLDKDKDKWLEAIEADGLVWNHVSDLKYWQSEAAQLYAVSGIPHTVLLDPEGKIIAKNLRGEELEAKLAELLN